MKTHILTLGLALVGCLNWQPNSTHDYAVWIDSGFSVDQSNAIMSAVNEWERKSGGFVRFHGTMDENAPDVIRFHSDPNSTALNQDCNSTNDLGCMWTDGVSSNVYVPITLDLDTFILTAKHETGHSIGANHIQPGNVMCSGIGCAAKTVQCGDLKEVCKEWNDPTCIPESMPGCQ